MYAVIQTGGKQYKVAKDDVFTVEKLAGEAGATVEFDKVLLVGDGDKATVGAPIVSGATVAAEIIEQTRGDKVVVFKKKRRQNYRRRNGHRQDLTLLRVTEILTDGEKPSKAKAAPKPKKAEEKPAEEKTEAKKAEPKKPAAKKADASKETTDSKKAPAAKKAPATKKAATKKAATKKAATKKKAAPKAKKEE